MPLCFALFYHRQLHVFDFTGHWLLVNDHFSHAFTPHATRATYRRDQRGQAVRRPSRWLLHATDRRIGKDRTGPDLDERRRLYSVCHRTRRFLRTNQSVSSRSPPPNRRPFSRGRRRSTPLSLSSSHDASIVGDDERQLAESVLELELPGHIVQKPVDLGDEILWDRGLPTQLDPYLNLQVVSHRRCADLTDLVGKVLNLVRLEVSGGDVNARRRRARVAAVGHCLLAGHTNLTWLTPLISQAHGPESVVLSISRARIAASMALRTVTQGSVFCTSRKEHQLWRVLSSCLRSRLLELIR